MLTSFLSELSFSPKGGGRLDPWMNPNNALKRYLKCMKINSMLTIALCDKRQFSGQNISCDEQIVAQICCFRMQFNAQGSVRTKGCGIYYSHAANYFIMKISFHINLSLTELVSSCHWWYFVFMFKRWQSFNWTLGHIHINTTLGQAGRGDKRNSFHRSGY